MDWLDLLAVQGTLKSLLQHHSSKASIIWHSVFFTVQLSHPYMTTGKTIALTRRTFAGKVMSLLFNMLFRLVITFPPRSKPVLLPAHHFSWRTLLHWFSNEGSSVQWGGMSADLLGCHNCGGSATSIYSVEPRDAVQYPIMYRTAFLHPNSNKKDRSGRSKCW